MEFPEPLIPGTILKRYKRFLADIRLENGRLETVHCPNSGSMRTCWAEGWPAMISDSHKPERKHRHTLEMTHNGTSWIGVNTQIPNKIAYEAIAQGIIPGLTGFSEVKREVKYGSQNSRIDLLGITAGSDKLCYIEVKNVTLVASDGTYQFPDAVTVRGQKHLEELMECVEQGHRAVMLYVIQRSDGTHFAPATSIDPEYTRKLIMAHETGVEIIPCQADVSPAGVSLTGQVVDYVLPLN